MFSFFICINICEIYIYILLSNGELFCARFYLHRKMCLAIINWTLHGKIKSRRLVYISPEVISNTPSQSVTSSCPLLIALVSDHSLRYIEMLNILYCI